MPNHLHTYYLQQMGVEIWELRKKPPAFEQCSLEELAQQVSSCKRCPLHQSRTHTVFARGNPHAKLMVIGEAPGFYEDQQGKPFVGKAGTLLNRMLASIDLSENEIYIANVLKCRPPENRDPTPEEIEQCSGHLVKQIQAVQPQLILAVGRFSGQFLLQDSALTLASMRGKIHYYLDTPVIVSYHPAYLLRKPEDKKKAYEDLLFLRKAITQKSLSHSVT